MNFPNLFFPVISGLLTAFSFTSDKNAFIVFLSIIPLFYSMRKTKRKFLYMFIYASVLHLTSVSWIVNATEFLPFEKEKNFIFLLLFLIVIAVIEGTIMGFPFLFWENVRKNDISDVFSFSMLYILGEFIQEYIPYVSFPWIRLSAIVAQKEIFIQTASLLGGLFVSFIIASINGLICVILENIVLKKKVILPIICLSLIICFNTAFSIIRTNTIKHEEKIAILLIQGNFSGEEKRTSDKNTITRKYLNLSYNNLSPDTKLIIFPETAMPFSFNEYNDGTRLVSAFARKNDITILTGICTYKDEKIFNSAVAFYPDGTFSEPYSKRILVPFGEKIWFYDTLLKIIPDVFGEMSTFTEGTNAFPIETEAGKIGVVICYESIYPRIARSTVRNDADILAIMSNDSWFGESRAMYQHHNHAILRAVENKRYVLRVSSTGVTSVISPTGEVINHAEPFREETLKAYITPVRNRSLYSIVGDIIIIPSATIFVYSVILYFLQGNKKPPYQQH
ncbi:MAG: apolipoprotein N-acyltransferase [Oscillospiraceae bacterium]|nr:apolipoprotein N-acyltransferase [Oscillospiraceae bacterium]